MKKFIANMDVSLAFPVVTLILLFVFAANSHAAPSAVDARINRYVLSISANDGGNNRPMLRYAESDAKSFANVLREMGGVQPQNVKLVKQPSVASLKQEFAKLDGEISQVKSNGGRNEVLVFYSGHADENGLHLGNEIYAWKEFRSRIDSLHADVKIAVIDACGSGAITRAKGGVAVPAFMVDESSDMKGYAFITSSTQDESSQESDRLKGSFFTHSLVSGLRGAGDVSGDGRVTLSEAYQFAFNETLQKTEATMGGAQHPSRDMNLAGTGDVVMTDLNSNGALLDLANDVDGRLFIRNESGELVAELNKKNGFSMSLGLPAGKYGVRLETTATVKETNVALVNGKHQSLALADFKNADVEKTVLRGEIGRKRDCASGDTVACSLDSLDRKVRFHTTFNAYDHETEPRKGMQIGVFATKSDGYMLGAQLSIFSNIARKEMRGVQAATIINIAKEHLKGVQVNSMLNYAKSFDGAQLSGMLNVAMEKSDGVQIAPFNIISDSLDGTQVGVFNYATYALTQVSAINIAGASGVQISAINVAGEVQKMQVGAINATGKTHVQLGAINVASQIENLQLGAINYATKAKRRQVGLVNIAPHADKTPVGLINIVGNGLWSLSGTFNEMGGWTLKLDLGTPYFYTSFEGGRVLRENNRKRPYMNGFGLGTHFGKFGSHLELEYMVLNMANDSMFDENYTWGIGIASSSWSSVLQRLRFGGVYEVFKGFGVVGGVSLNLQVSGSADDHVAVTPIGEYHADVSNDGRFWPGFYAGLVVGRF